MLMPSEMESFGLAALEAMACGVPTIATRVGGVPELIQHGHNGLLFPVGDVDAMSTAAISLLSDQHRLEAMAKAGRKTAQDHFCSSRVIPLYEDYYTTASRHPHSTNAIGIATAAKDTSGPLLKTQLNSSRSSPAGAPEIPPSSPSDAPRQHPCLRLAQLRKESPV